MGGLDFLDLCNLFGQMHVQRIGAGKFGVMGQILHRHRAQTVRRHADAAVRGQVGKCLR